MTSTARREFKVHSLNTLGQQKATTISEAMADLLSKLEDICGSEGREIALVRTHMEMAGFYAKKAMALQAENHQP